MIPSCSLHLRHDAPMTREISFNWLASAVELVMRGRTSRLAGAIAAGSACSLPCLVLARLLCVAGDLRVCDDKALPDIPERNGWLQQNGMGGLKIEEQRWLKSRSFSGPM